jgi:hypothetical protein
MGISSPKGMEITFIVSAAIIFVMIALRTLELRFQRPIILAHLSWPADRRMRVHFKKFRRFISETVRVKAREVESRVRESVGNAYGKARSGSEEYIGELQASLRGKKALSRGSVSFFLLNISDYNLGRKKPAEAAQKALHGETLSSEVVEIGE